MTLPSIDFKEFLQKKNDWDTSEFPFTKTNTEDAMFLGRNEALALECIFY